MHGHLEYEADPSRRRGKDNRYRFDQWLRREINDAWQNRENIEPSYEGTPKPNVIEILKLLLMTNCKECGEPTCMVFAARMAEGIKALEDCPPMGAENKQRLAEYMHQFKFDV